MKEQTAVVIGATGLVGQILVEKLLADPDFKKVRILVRRETGIEHPKLEERIVRFDHYLEFTNQFGEGDVIFSCVGTTQKKVQGDQEAYRKIDFDIPVDAAKIGIEKGFQKFMLVSSVGADPASKNFYLRLKGETEEAIRTFPFKSIGLFRPSILLGERNEVRSGEKAAKILMRFFSRLLIGGYRKYRAIDARDVAAAMIRYSKQEDADTTVFEYDAIMLLSKAK